jgi:hypothetical protein
MNTTSQVFFSRKDAKIAVVATDYDGKFIEVLTVHVCPIQTSLEKWGVLNDTDVGLEASKDTIIQQMKDDGYYLVDIEKCAPAVEERSDVMYAVFDRESGEWLSKGGKVIADTYDRLAPLQLPGQIMEYSVAGKSLYGPETCISVAEFLEACGVDPQYNVAM